MASIERCAVCRTVGTRSVSSVVVYAELHFDTLSDAIIAIFTYTVDSSKGTLVFCNIGILLIGCTSWTESSVLSGSALAVFYDASLLAR